MAKFANGKNRLITAAELWQACDRCLRLTRCTPQTGSWLHRGAPDNLNDSSSKLRTGAADPKETVHISPQSGR
jgi:hypothetical protein